MGKLLKYEFIKSKYYVLITAGAVLLTALVALFGQFTHNDEVWATGIALFAVCGFFGVMALMIFSVTIFTSDISKKHGYMVFLTPRSAYQVVGSKLLVSLIALVVGFAAYAALALYLSMGVGERLSHEGNYFTVLLAAIPKKTVPLFVTLVFSWLIQWFTAIVTVYFSVTLVHTLLARAPLKGAMAAVVFVLINWGASSLGRLLLSRGGFTMQSDHMAESLSELAANYSFPVLGGQIAIYAAIGVGLYLLTAYLVEKKLSM